MAQGGGDDFDESGELGGGQPVFENQLAVRVVEGTLRVIHENADCSGFVSEHGNVAAIGGLVFIGHCDNLAAASENPSISMCGGKCEDIANQSSGPETMGVDDAMTDRTADELSTDVPGHGDSWSQESGTDGFLHAIADAKEGNTRIFEALITFLEEYCDSDTSVGIVPEGKSTRINEVVAFMHLHFSAPDLFEKDEARIATSKLHCLHRFYFAVGARCVKHMHQLSSSGSS